MKILTTKQVNDILDKLADIQRICNEGISDPLILLDASKCLADITYKIGGAKGCKKVMIKGFNMQDLKGVTNEEENTTADS